MPKRISFVLLDHSGNPLTGATPTITVYRNSEGEALVAPDIEEQGNGFYEFVVELGVDESVAYLIDAGANSSVQYLTGSVGEFISFGMYDLGGNPDGARTPSFISWDDGTIAPPPEPDIINLTGGLYGFWSPIDAGKLIRYVVGDADNKLWGTIGNTLLANASPVAESEIPNTQSISFDVLDTETELGRVLIGIKYPAFQGATELAWDGEAVCGPFQVTSVPITNGLRYTVLRLGGWPSSPIIRVFVTNFGGREL